jgi:hypothetical protein
MSAPGTTAAPRGRMSEGPPTGAFRQRAVTRSRTSSSHSSRIQWGGDGAAAAVAAAAVAVAVAVAVGGWEPRPGSFGFPPCPRGAVAAAVEAHQTQPLRIPRTDYGRCLWYAPVITPFATFCPNQQVK